MIEEKGKNVYEQWWFWAGLIALVVLSLLGGIVSGSDGEVEPLAEQEASSSVQARESSPGGLMQFEAMDGSAHQASISRVLKLIQKGMIQRIDEEHRLLYINDPVWRISPYEQKEETARQVAEYLDWAQNNHTGMVEVRSFRSGRRVAGINQTGTFYTY